MSVPSRSRRRHHVWRMRRRILRYDAMNGTRANALPPDPRSLGKLVSTHYVPAVCSKICGHRRAREGPSHAELRRIAAAEAGRNA